MVLEARSNGSFSDKNIKCEMTKKVSFFASNSRSGSALEQSVKGSIVNQDYLDTIAAVERLHRRCLEVIKTELDRSGVRDINNIQSLILFNIGD